MLSEKDESQSSKNEARNRRSCFSIDGPFSSNRNSEGGAKVLRQSQFFSSRKLTRGVPLGVRCPARWRR